MDHPLIVQSISFVMRNVPLVLLAIALVIGMASNERPRARALLSWILLLPVGLGGLWAGIAHVAYPKVAASYIGWATSPFQFEVGMADIAMGVAGVLAFRASWGFRAATVLIVSIFFLGDAWGHVRQMQLTHDFSIGNAGPPFWMDIGLPLLMIVLLLGTRSSSGRR